MARLPDTFRREQILEAGLEFVRQHGFPALTCEAVAKEADCSYKTVARRWANRELLAQAIVAYARQVGDRAMVKAGERVTA